MPIQLDKILGDIAEEKVLHPFYPNPSKKETDDAWARVGKKNKLSVHEARSIFKVLQKKFDQEKMKDASSWKLFSVMEDIHKKFDENKETGEPPGSADEEEFVEMLEVHEEEEMETENLNVSKKSSTHSLDNDVKSDATGIKIVHNQKQHITSHPLAFQKKGIVMKKTPSLVSSTPTALHKTNTSQNLHNALTAAVKSNISNTPSKITTINTSELTNSSKSTYANDNKRKLSMDAATNSLIIKKQALSSSGIPMTTIPIVDVKLEPDEIKQEQIHPKINVITIPGNPTQVDLANGLTATSSTNGYPSCIEDIDFRSDIIFDSGTTAGVVGNHTKGAASSDIINIGNFENHLPPTFFKNLCNSNRHEALGLYVANVMNRVTPATAAKLELKILRAIIDAKSEEMET